VQDAVFFAGNLNEIFDAFYIWSFLLKSAFFSTKYMEQNRSDFILNMGVESLSKIRFCVIILIHISFCPGTVCGTRSCRAARQRNLTIKGENQDGIFSGSLGTGV
jgi:hypothetical protein